ncbi:MAG: T9SS type A sorting domain-containing protein [Flavobacteriales bacterium]
MHRSILYPAFFIVGSAVAQWSVTDGSFVNARIDDVFFINADTGWFAGGSSGMIARTYTGGANWQTVYTGPDYLRSIEFATPQLGFCGALRDFNDIFLKTTDGGDTWQDISGLIPAPLAICGLYATSPQVIYGAGVWNGPAYVIRTMDGGNSWTKFDLSNLASRLVDVYFLNDSVGYAAGTAEPPSSGGVILYTGDRGENWSIRHLTGYNEEYIWKLQSPNNGKNIYGSVESDLIDFGTRFVQTSDSGTTWTTDLASPDYHYMQAIGFLDTLHGWMGGNILLETIDGGITWSMDTSITTGFYDRFHRVNNGLAYMTGLEIYKYGGNDLSGIVVTADQPIREWVDAYPIPATDEVTLMVHLIARSSAVVSAFASDGTLVRSIYKGALPAGDSQFKVDVRDLQPGTYFLSMRTNQGMRGKVIVLQ